MPDFVFWILNLHIIICQFQKKATLIHFFVSDHVLAMSVAWSLSHAAIDEVMKRRQLRPPRNKNNQKQKLDPWLSIEYVC